MDAIIKSFIEKTTTTTSSTTKNKKRLKLEYVGYEDEDWPYIWVIRNGNAIDWKNDCTTEEEIIDTTLKQQDLPIKIMEGVFLDDSTCIQNYCDCNDDVDSSNTNWNNIGYVLNMAGNDTLSRKTVTKLRRKNIVYKAMSAKDENDYPLLEKHWYDAYECIQQAVESGNKGILVHCKAGYNRSVLIVAAYYMISNQNAAILKTIKHIRKLRGNGALKNEGFQQQLVAFARLHQKLAIFQTMMPPRPGQDHRHK